MDHTWYDDKELDGGTPEIHEHHTAPGPALELRAVVVDGCRVKGLWLTEEGRVLREARVGQA